MSALESTLHKLARRALEKKAAFLSPFRTLSGFAQNRRYRMLASDLRGRYFKEYTPEELEQLFQYDSGYSDRPLV
jgi:hypothetical protein